MIANFHTHTPRCNHAVGSEDAYIRCALEAGLQTLGFSDHSPYPFPKGYYSSFRMKPHELQEYADTVLQLRKAYAGQIQIPLGLEVEYYPKFFPELVRMLKDHGIEYMLLGQHFLYNEMEGVGSNGPTADEALLRQYCDQTIEAMHTGLFTYFAHPDLIHYAGDWKFYMDTVRPMCAEAKKCGIPLEINLLGIREGRHYPNRFFWEMAAEEGCEVILGCDAHTPQSLNDPKAEREALALAKEFDLKVLETAVLRSIHK